MIQHHADRGRCAVTPEPLNAGVVVARFSGAPYACCPMPSERERVCTACFVAASTADWERHKHECSVLHSQAGRLQELADAPVSDLLLLGRCLWRRRAVAEKPRAEDVAFDELKAGEITQGDWDLARLAAAMPGLLPPSLCGKPNISTCAEILACFRVNNFGITNELHRVVGAGCYPAAAILNHSCHPNCVLFFAGANLQVRTCTDVLRGDELCHSYIELCQPTALRREELRSRYGFECACARCCNGLFVDGEDVDAAMLSSNPSINSLDPSFDSALETADSLLRQAEAEEDERAELELCREAVTLLRKFCHRWSTLRYRAEGRCLSVALPCGENEVALESCRSLVNFLEVTLHHVPYHPLLALQHFTLCDLELEVGDRSRAKAQMEACTKGLAISHGKESSVRSAAHERWHKEFGSADSRA
ncbi:hypothetical protein AB1Y20_000486 [Prymnesium parvum]|uniref:SET domain-containing protein n=1 Tax=Prymnesium parvum TaxID=97485 RepID=A0AB34K967_PRYPA